MVRAPGAPFAGDRRDRKFGVAAWKPVKEREVARNPHMVIIFTIVNIVEGMSARL